MNIILFLKRNGSTQKVKCRAMQRIRPVSSQDRKDTFNLPIATEPVTSVAFSIKSSFHSKNYHLQTARRVSLNLKMSVHRATCINMIMKKNMYAKMFTSPLLSSPSHCPSPCIIALSRRLMSEANFIKLPIWTRLILHARGRFPKISAYTFVCVHVTLHICKHFCQISRHLSTVGVQ